MRILLLHDIKSLGKKGDVREVSDGYARNFLLPRKMVQIATQGAVRKATETKTREKEREAEEMEQKRKMAKDIEGRKILIKAKEKEGKLFGSISTKDIAEALKKENLKISENSIILEEAIKKVGKYGIKLKLSKEIETQIELEISGEK